LPVELYRQPRQEVEAFGEPVKNAVTSIDEDLA
jgi:hypothetical protein